MHAQYFLEQLKSPLAIQLLQEAAYYSKNIHEYLAQAVSLIIHVAMYL